MTLSELALLVGADSKWLLNAAAVLPMPRRYTLALARRLTLARALQSDLGVPLPRAYAMAGEALRRYVGDATPVTLAQSGAGTVEVRIDVHRELSALSVRMSQLQTMYAPRRRGPRPSARRDPLRAASDYGLDLSLLRANLGRTPTERLRQLDGMAQFARRVRRPR
ncbi:MAG: hypothetical protein WD825_13800 [Gemmatimonadaceae bacterium]